MMSDIKRICEQPTDEDRTWFPAFAGVGDWRPVLKDAWANYRDESFIEQFLSPKVMRDLRLFALADQADQPAVTVSAIHNERGYRQVRSTLARQYDVGIADPNIQVTGANLTRRPEALPGASHASRRAAQCADAGHGAPAYRASLGLRRRAGGSRRNLDALRRQFCVEVVVVVDVPSSSPAIRITPAMMSAPAPAQ